MAARAVQRWGLFDLARLLLDLARLSFPSAAWKGRFSADRRNHQREGPTSAT
jgi:hypothetical protein